MRFILVGLVLFSLIGCINENAVDTSAPLPPQGIVTVSLDQAIELTWYPSQDRDVAGYKVWVSNAYDGTYESIGRTAQTRFVDDGAVNGVTYYYAVSAYDNTGNESALSKDVIYDTPRPEGAGVVLADYFVTPALAGYDFSSFLVTRYNDVNSDVFFENANSLFFLNVRTDSDIQDMGYTATLDDISQAPAFGWAPSGTAEAIPGHTYVIWTWDDHYAKIRVREVGAGGVKFDWAYQTAATNPELSVVGAQKKKHDGIRNASIVREE
jgi:hypothetical protein